MHLKYPFDNFEKENASEKKRKKIYMTESEIQKLIEKRKNEKEDDSVEIDDEDLDLEKSVNENTLKEE